MKFVLSNNDTILIRYFFIIVSKLIFFNYKNIEFVFCITRKMQIEKAMRIIYNFIQFPINYIKFKIVLESIKEFFLKNQKEILGWIKQFNLSFLTSISQNKEGFLVIKVEVRKS